MACREDILFLFPPAYTQAGSFVSHLGASYMRARLHEFGFKSAQYLNAQPGTIKEIANEVVSRRPGIVGFTAYDENFPLSLSIARALKQQRPEIKIVFGGPSVTFNSKELLARHQVIDLCMLGESEDTAPRVLSDLLNGLLPSPDQPGVAFRQDGEIVCNDTAPLVGANVKPPDAALDVVPSPYLSGLLDNGRTGIMTSRGCTHHCQYCCFAALGRRTLRLHSLERVLAELEFIAQQQRHSGEGYVVSIHDDCFTLLPHRAKRLCQEIATRNLGLRLSCITRADTVDDELLTLMRAAGVVDLSFGLESAVPSVLRAIGKVRPSTWPNKDLQPERDFLQRFRTSTRLATKLGFHVGISIILGLPTETPVDAQATMRFVRSLSVDYYAHNFLGIFPGTPLWDTHSRYHLKCRLNEIGIPVTTAYPYKVFRIHPSHNCRLVSDQRFACSLAADAVRDCQGPPVVQGSISTVVLERDELTSELGEWLRDVLVVGGIVVQIYSESARRNCGQRMRRDRHTIKLHLVPARYYIQLQQRTQRLGSIRYNLTGVQSDLCRHVDPSLLSFEYRTSSSALGNWLRGTGKPCAIFATPPELLHSDNLTCLVERINGHQCSPLHGMSYPPRLEHPGRWLNGVGCQPLSRVVVDGAGKVRCCGSADPIGMIGDTVESIHQRLSKSVQSISERRRCQTCSMTECPRCPFPGIDDEAYCKAVTDAVRHRKALSWIRLYSRLPSLVSNQLSG